MNLTKPKHMSDLFKNKYRIPSNRLCGWDYAHTGHYYITIVTYDRIPYFGHIQDGEMVLNEMGQIVFDEFFKSFKIRSELFLGAFVLMPNHIHAIVILVNPEQNDNHVETHGRASLQPPKSNILQPFHRQPKSISSFVAGFKSATIKRIDDWIDENNMPLEKFNSNNPLWQSNYHDHIIRNEIEYRDIAQYIADNPKYEDDDP